MSFKKNNTNTYDLEGDNCNVNSVLKNRSTLLSAPSFGNNNGTKIIISETQSATSSNYSIGTNTSELWFNNYTNSTFQRFYGGGTLRLTIGGNDTLATGVNTGTLRVSGGISSTFPCYFTQMTAPLITYSFSTRSGAGAIPITDNVCKITTTGGTSNALTLANGASGQTLYLTLEVISGNAVITPSTKQGFSTVTLTAVGQTVSMIYTSNGWIIKGSFGATIA